MIPILNKCLSELRKESPSIPYVCGMLETLIEMYGATPIHTQSMVIPKWPPPNPQNNIQLAKALDDEGTVIEAKTRASLDQVKKMSEESIQNG